MKDLLDQPLKEEKSFVWATISVIVGLIGLFTMVYFSYQIVFNMTGAPTSDSHRIAAVRDQMMSAGLILICIYLISLVCLVISFVKESHSVARVISSVGHLMMLITILYRILNKFV